MDGWNIRGRSQTEGWKHCRWCHQVLRSYPGNVGILESSTWAETWNRDFLYFHTFEQAHAQRIAHLFPEVCFKTSATIFVSSTWEAQHSVQSKKLALTGKPAWPFQSILLVLIFWYAFPFLQKVQVQAYIRHRVVWFSWIIRQVRLWFSGWYILVRKSIQIHWSILEAAAVPLAASLTREIQASVAWSSRPDSCSDSFSFILARRRQNEIAVIRHTSLLLLDFDMHVRSGPNHCCRCNLGNVLFNGGVKHSCQPFPQALPSN